ncbi:MAG: beta-lactamase family protein [Parvularculaceae bacterium]|nr:beta-lactamase family protein [Parvularculaceae bacterium]
MRSPALGRAMLGQLQQVLVGLVSLSGAAIAQAQPGSFESIGETLTPSMEAVIDQGALGVAVVAVADGEVIFRAGRGSARVDQLEAIDLAATPFRLASLGKSVVSMTALRLEAQGLLDLDEDIATYLGTEAPAMPLGPVTMRQLLSHTSGIDAEPVGDAARSADKAMPLEALIRDHLPAQRYEPSKVFIYSNHGYALAGRVIEKVTGTPFSEVVQREVFMPLEMSGSRFGQDDLRVDVAQSTVDGKLVPQSVSNVLPADGWVGTADDVARYLRAHLAMAPDDPLIKAGLHGAAFTHTSDLPQQGLGWEVRRWGQDRVLSHTGGVDGFSSIMVILPERNFGIAILLNSRRADLRGNILDEVRRAFFTASPDVAANRATRGPGVEVSDLSGLYLSENRPHGKMRWASRLGLTGGLLDVSADQAGLDVGGISYSLESSKEPDRSEAQYGYRIHFDRASNGALYAFEGRDAYRRLSFLQRPGVLLSALLAGLVASLIRTGSLFVQGRRNHNIVPANLWLLLCAICFLVGAALFIVGLGLSGDISFGLLWLHKIGGLVLLASIGCVLIGIVTAVTSHARMALVSRLLTGLTIIGHIAAVEAGVIGSVVRWT